jgi:8-oxo-dGTP pyrophosphatase MutT (NUDIX family)
MPRISRRAARVLPVDSQGRVLLLLGRALLRRRERFWMSAGGGVERGESLAQAAARELREEAGIRLDPAALGTPVGTSVIEFTTFGLLPVTQHQTYFAVAVDDTGVTFDGQGILERLTITGYEWLTAEGAVRRPERLSDSELPRLMRVAVTAVSGAR